MKRDGSRTPTCDRILKALVVVAALSAAAACAPSVEARRADGVDVSGASVVPGAEGDGELGQWVVAGGMRRTYGLHLPPAHDASRPHPLLLVFHGAGGSRSLAEDVGLNAAADRLGFIVVSPHGVGGSWALGCGGCTEAERAGVDDVGFVAILVEHLAQHVNVDRERVYATGISDGGSFTNRLACEYPLTGAGVVAGSMFLSPYLCRPPRDVSVVGIHGTADSIIHVSTGWGPMTMWAELNGCGEVASETPLPDLEPADRTTVTRYDFPDCQNGTDVVFYAVEDGGHNWPGTGGGMGLPNFDIDATEVVMSFFSQHPVAP